MDHLLIAPPHTHYLSTQTHYSPLTPCMRPPSAVQMYPGEAGKVRFLSDVRRLLGLSETTVINVNFECSAPPAFEDLSGGDGSCTGAGAGAQLSLKGLETWDAAVFCATMAAARKAAETGGADVTGGAMSMTGGTAEMGAAAQPVAALSAPASELGDLLSRTRELLDSVGAAAAAVTNAAGGEVSSEGTPNGSREIFAAPSAAASRASVPSSTSHGAPEGSRSSPAMQPPSPRSSPAMRPPSGQPIAASRQTGPAAAAVGSQRREGQQQQQPEGQQQSQEQLQPAPWVRMPQWQRFVQAWEAVRPCFC